MMYQVRKTTSGNTRSESGILVTLKETSAPTGTMLPVLMGNVEDGTSCTESDTARQDHLHTLATSWRPHPLTHL